LGVRAGRDGIRIWGNIIRIPWRDLESVDFVSAPDEVGDTWVRGVLVTHHYGRFPLLAARGGTPMPPREWIDFALTLLAMRDRFAPNVADRGEVPSDTSAPVRPLPYMRTPETDLTSGVDHGESENDRPLDWR